MQPIATQEQIEAGLAELSRADPRLRPVIEKAGPVPLRLQPSGYAGLAGIVVSQMVSRASADAIHARLLARLGEITPAGVLSLEEADFRQIGLSRAKQAALLGLARAVADEAIDLDAVRHLSAEKAIADLTALPGIGPWTAEVYLLFCGGHPDIFPAGDVALQAAAAHAFSLATRPTARDLRIIAEEWSPFRGVAARLLWAYYGTEIRRTVAPVGS
jgi:DNA-3-methyladenine glycosylase II